MSGPRFQQEGISGSQVELEAAQFIERRDCVGWSEQDRAEFDEWVATSPAHRIAFLRLNAGWKRAERLAALRPRERVWRASSISLAAKKIAAALGLVVLIGGGGGYYISLPKYTVYATKLGERETLTLRDGSRIELNTDTVVQIPDGSDRRHIRLEKGEAYFDVVHDEAHPFTVSAGEGRVTDIGTKFVVRREAGQLLITMLQGAARFDGSGEGTQTKSVILRSGDVVVASAEGIKLTKKPESEAVRETSWRQGLLVFNETPLATVAAEFNRYNHTKIIIKDPKIAEVGIGGTFATANVSGFARVAQGLLGLHVESRDDEILISR